MLRPSRTSSSTTTLPRDFREIDRDAFLQGVVMNMAVPVEMIGRVVDGMAERGFGRIVNITRSR